MDLVATCRGETLKEFHTDAGPTCTPNSSRILRHRGGISSSVEEFEFTDAARMLGHAGYAGKRCFEEFGEQHYFTTCVNTAIPSSGSVARFAHPPGYGTELGWVLCLSDSSPA
jgi:hypothetical protein